MKNAIFNKLLNINIESMRLLFFVLLGSVLLSYIWNDWRIDMDNFVSIFVLPLGISFFAILFVRLCFFDKPNYHYAILLIERIRKLCHQYKSATNDNDIDKIVYDIINGIDIELANTCTIGFWLCAMKHYKGKLVESYLNFVENKLTRGAIKELDDAERRLQKYRQKQAKKEFEENKKRRELVQNIDLWFGKAKMQAKDT